MKATGEHSPLLTEAGGSLGGGATRAAASLLRPSHRVWPADWASTIADTIAAAKKEGKVVVYATTDTKAADPLIKDFESLYPNSSHQRMQRFGCHHHSRRRLFIRSANAQA